MLRLGILGVSLDRRLADMLPVLRVPSGVVVAATVPGAIDCREGGLAAGDVIHAVNRNRWQGSPSSARSSISEHGDSVVLQLERRRELI